MDSYNVQLHWDDEAKVWWSESEDIPGLLLEDETADKLIERLLIAAPEIMELNDIEKRSKLNFICIKQGDIIFD